MSLLRKLKMLPLAFAALLFGCSQSNPLDTLEHKTVAQALLKSAISSEIQLGLAPNTAQAGRYYESCMNEEKRGSGCERLYHQMVKELRKKSAYKDVTIANLTEQKMWSFVKGYYRAGEFNRVPGIDY